MILIPWDRRIRIKNHLKEIQENGVISMGEIKCLDVPGRNLGSMVRTNGFFFSPPYKWGMNWGENNPLIRSPLILTSWHIQVGSEFLQSLRCNSHGTVPCGHLQPWGAEKSPRFTNMAIAGKSHHGLRMYESYQKIGIGKSSHASFK